MEADLEGRIAAQRPQLERWVRGRFPSLDAAELADRAICRALLRWASPTSPPVRDGSSFEGYLWATLRTTVVDELRARSRLESLDAFPAEIAAAASTETVLDAVEAGDDRAVLLQSLAALDTRRKGPRALLLSLAALSGEEIDQILSPPLTADAPASPPEVRSPAAMRRGLDAVRNGRDLVRRRVSRSSAVLPAQLSSEEFAAEVGELIHHLDLDPDLSRRGLYRSLAKVARRVLEGHRSAETGWEAGFTLARCLHHVGRLAECEQIERSLLTAPLPADLRARICISLARLLQEQPLRRLRGAMWQAACSSSARPETLFSAWDERLEEGEALLTMAERLAPEGQEPPLLLLQTAHRRGHQALLHGEAEVAAATYTAALHAARSRDHLLTLHHLHKALARLELRSGLLARLEGDGRRAQEAFQAAAGHLRRGLATSGGYVRGQADIRLDLATHAMAVGQPAEARAALLAARELARRIGTRFHLADASTWLESAA